MVETHTHERLTNKVYDIRTQGRRQADNCERNSCRKKYKIRSDKVAI